MDRIGIPAERVGQAVQLGQEPGLRRDLPRRYRVECGHRVAQFRRHRIALPVAIAHETHHAGPRAGAAAMGEDGGVRWTTAAAAGSTLVAALLVSACSAATAVQATAARPPSADKCYSFAV